MFTHRATRCVACLVVAAVWSLVAGSPARAWVWPVDGAVLRGYAVDGDKYAAGQHRGIDIAVGEGASIRAPAAGEVSFAGQVPTYGLTVTIVTGDGYKASLTHLGTLRVRKGAIVAEGDPIADPGPSGDAEHAVPYVHLGIRVGEDAYVDPLGLLPPRSAPNPPPAPAAPPAPAPSPAPAPAPPPAGEQAEPTSDAPAPTPAAPEPSLPASDAPAAAAEPAPVVTTPVVVAESMSAMVPTSPAVRVDARAHVASVPPSVPAEAGAADVQAAARPDAAARREAVDARDPSANASASRSYVRARARTADLIVVDRPAAHVTRVPDLTRRHPGGFAEPGDAAAGISIRRRALDMLPAWVGALLVIILGGSILARRRGVREPLPIIGAHAVLRERHRSTGVAVRTAPHRARGGLRRPCRHPRSAPPASRRGHLLHDGNRRACVEGGHASRRSSGLAPQEYARSIHRAHGKRCHGGSRPPITSLSARPTRGHYAFIARFPSAHLREGYIVEDEYAGLYASAAMRSDGSGSSTGQCPRAAPSPSAIRENVTSSSGFRAIRIDGPALFRTTSIRTSSSRRLIATDRRRESLHRLDSCRTSSTAAQASSTGACDPCRGIRIAPTSASTSGPMRSSAISPLRSSAPRTVERRTLRDWWQAVGRRHRDFGEGHHPVPLRVLARELLSGAPRRRHEIFALGYLTTRHPQVPDVARESQYDPYSDLVRLLAGADPVRYFLTTRAVAFRSGRHGVVSNSPRRNERELAQRSGQSRLSVPPAMIDRFLGGELPAVARGFDSPVAALVEGLADDVARRFDNVRSHGRARADLGGRPRS